MVEAQILLGSKQENLYPIYRLPILRYTEVRKRMDVQVVAGRRICAGYYRRYDGKVVYVVSLATDADTGEETVIWTAYPFAEVPKYCTSSKKFFCAFVEVKGARKAKYKRLMNMKISEAAIERLEDEGFRGPVRKR